MLPRVVWSMPEYGTFNLQVYRKLSLPLQYYIVLLPVFVILQLQNQGFREIQSYSPFSQATPEANRSRPQPGPFQIHRCGLGPPVYPYLLGRGLLAGQGDEHQNEEKIDDDWIRQGDPHQEFSGP